jgi:phage shock protein E
MNRSSFFLVSGIGTLLYTVYAGLKYYAITGLGLLTDSEAKQFIKEGRIKYIIDVRTETEFNIGHFPKAKNIPIQSFSKNKFKNFSKDKQNGILVYCNTGQRARRAAELLRSYRFSNVYYIESTYHNIQ